MFKLYIVTGAAGHLGTAIVRALQQKGASIRGLIQPGQRPTAGPGTRYFTGDICDAATLRPLFEGVPAGDTAVIHTAGIVDIAQRGTDRLWQVNVLGTQNMIDCCQRYQIARLVYVSSVHAIPERGQLHTVREVAHFSPDLVVGGYAKTKAAATRRVLLAAAAGLDAVVVHPSGILGPYSDGGNHLVQMVEDYMNGRLPACVRGAYDFVDVRDVADGCVAAADRGRRGRCYILSGDQYTVKEVLELVRRTAGGRKLAALPMWVARAVCPAISWIQRRRGRRPLYTPYALHTLTAGSRFSHERASRELGYTTRDLAVTVADTVCWLREGAVRGTWRTKRRADEKI
ncbi:NAD-dependent epimerase/dehydratase family protein [Neobittarella massiliensis]|uniref:NAD-dependent epimerase/dehydratase family protein n=1 Tax=Neobittarella massiliensis (ex Bilen et al. 2018) TaxID=2041842 RepID=UPI000CF6520F|nr:NAD-dependent epimerase/dehydratase family protein [Neobittarella massiliensis]